MARAATDRHKRRGACLAAAALVCALFVALASQGASSAPPPPGAAKVVVSKPKPDAIAEAIAAVEPGGKVRIRKGRYRESLLIEKPVRLVGVGEGRPTIDGLCQFPSTVTIHSGGVTLKRLNVQGAGSFAAVDFSGVPDGRAQDLRVRNTCDAEYGINVFATGAVRVIDNRASGFTDAGIYVGDITSTPNGTLLVAGNRSFGNNKGVIVEFSAGGDILVLDNEIRDNDLAGIGEQVGLFVFDSDGVRIESNRIHANGQTGLVLTPNSDNNSITTNLITGNPIDVRNEGVGNCGSGNAFATGGPLGPC